MAKRSQVKTNSSSSSSSKQPQKRARKSKSSKSRPPRILHIEDLPNEILNKIFLILESHEQGKLRRVCHRLKDCVEKIFEETRLLKLNLLWTVTDRKHKYHSWTPAITIQSLQFDSNWTEPSLELSKKAQFTVQEHHFNEDCAEALGRLFSQVHYLVIYFDLEEEQENFDNFLNMLTGFRSLESFSLIRSSKLNDRQFFPTLCLTLEQMPPMRRLELYLSQYYHHDIPRHEIQMVNAVSRLEHFVLISWPVTMTPREQQDILQNLCWSLRNVRQSNANEPHELTSLCFPIDLWFLLANRLNLAQLVKGNPEFANVNRLQLTHATEIGHVSQSLQFFPKLQSLQLYLESNQEVSEKLQFNSNRFLDMINKCEHLTELKIFDGCLGKYEEGLKAPRIKKLTIGADSLFTDYEDVLEEREDEQREEEQRENEQPQNEQQPVRGTLQVRMSNEFVNWITQTFPSLEELTVMSNEWFERKRFQKLKHMITSKLRAKCKDLKVNINMWHVIYEC